VIDHGRDSLRGRNLAAVAIQMFGTQKSRLSWDAKSADLWEMTKDDQGWNNLISRSSSEPPLDLAEHEYHHQYTDQCRRPGSGGSKMATILTQPARRRMPARFRIYVPIAVFTLVVAFVGFWANYYG